MKYRNIVLALVLAFTARAQQPPTAPVQAKRLPPGKAKQPSPAEKSVLDQYDFGAQIIALQDDGSFATGSTVKPVLATPLPSPESGVPANFRPRTEKSTDSMKTLLRVWNQRGTRFMIVDESSSASPSS